MIIKDGTKMENYIMQIDLLLNLVMAVLYGTAIENYIEKTDLQLMMIRKNGGSMGIVIVMMDQEWN